MMTRDWPTVMAHVDADCFYASCERARHPRLRTVPLCVLSSHDACVVAKTYDAKAAGIKTGMPVWEAKKRMPTATFVSADFGYYGQVSDQLFTILRRYSPDIEVYSIDEGFIGLNGLCGLWRRGGYRDLADNLRETVQSEMGITVSIGVSVTKTLAKIASEYHKPNGTTLIPGTGIEAFLAHITTPDIPGIGHNRAALLEKFGITTALQFIHAAPALLKRLLGKHGTDLWHELRGESVYPLELKPKPPKTLAKTASFGEVTSSREVIVAHVTHHLARLAAELCAKRYVIKRLTVFLRYKSFESIGWQVRFPYPTSNYFAMSQALQEVLATLYQEGVLYRACGVIASEISAGEAQSEDLFGVIQRDARQGSLFSTVDQINRKYGTGTARMLATLPLKIKARPVRFHYPMLEAD